MVDMVKRTEIAQETIVSFLKEAQSKGIDLGEILAAVIGAMDFSGSMGTRYENGEVQDLFERFLAMALAGLDDDGDIQTYMYDHDVYPMEVVNESNYRGFVNTWRKGKRMGGTDMLPMMKTIIESLFPGWLQANGFGSAPLPQPEKKSFFRRKNAVPEPEPGGAYTPPGPVETPYLVFIVCDGDTANEAEVKRLITAAAALPIFWQFLGLGPGLDFIQVLNNNLPGRVIDNVGTEEMMRSTDMSDEDWFKKMLEEFITKWLPAARALGIVA